MDLVLGLVSLVILVYSAILHEIAHGFVAEKLVTHRKTNGKINVEPQKPHRSFYEHPFAFTFDHLRLASSFRSSKAGSRWSFNFRDGRKDLAIVALAGPATNVLIAVAAAVALKILMIFAASSTSSLLIPVATFLALIVRMNLLLAIFNFIPIPPLDGSKVFALLLPDKEAAAYMSVGHSAFW